LHLGLRIAYLTAAVLLLLILPFDRAGVLLVVFVAVDLTAAAFMLRTEPTLPGSVVTIDGDVANLDLLRRTVPALRSRRPLATVEAQVRWRETADARRRGFRIVS
jgi:hypothetical protein